MRTKKFKFDYIVAELVNRTKRIKGLSNRDISVIIDKSEGYIRKIHSPGSNNRYNLFHLFLLSEAWNISIADFIPSKKNLRELHEYKSKTDDEIDQILEEVIQELKEEKS